MAYMLILNPVKMITVLDDEDHVCAFPVSDRIKFSEREKELMLFARLDLKSCRQVFICDALRVHGDTPESASTTAKIKMLLSKAALNLGLSPDMVARDIKTLGCLHQYYWRQETSLLDLGFQKADVHIARITWLTHLTTWY